ncbi:hypothetical protein [Phaeocystidibacter marisrubri]|uniref:Uncharacterized protein n=1 Tax=Phaeocystidibacter marisrubri TaxID=1577780 RepID=A0A6L3ZGW4_9FLAO|nr:hypothetical protein [Phaeocystidibacter marisrubri]KAB2816818.1 hypothetical protein F8C82_00010 [Phaeocystidibacter marisrubri]GGH78021.1 hypothetical protein GCM10011318_28670 [Phaeocystidibacter marisrubri]
MRRIVQVEQCFITPRSLDLARPIGVTIADEFGNRFEIIERFTIGRRRDNKEYWASYKGDLIKFGTNPRFLAEGIGIDTRQLTQYFDELEEDEIKAPVARVHLLKSIATDSVNQQAWKD